MIKKNSQEKVQQTKEKKITVENVTSRLIEATIYSGSFSGQGVFFPRIPFISLENLPFKFKRIQFSVKIGYCITINKSQGQTYNIVRLYLDNCM